MNAYGILAVFDTPADAMHAAEKVRDAPIRIDRRPNVRVKEGEVGDADPADDPKEQIVDALPLAPPEEEHGPDPDPAEEPRRAKESFYADCPAGTTESAVPRLCPQPFSTFMQPVTGAAWKKIPSTYVECIKDGAIPIEQQRVSHQKLGERAQEMMEDQLYGIDASVDLLRFSISEDLLFAPGSTELRPEAQKHLVRLGRILESYPGYVKIEGHTDGQESPGKPVGSEFEFALTRAVSVMKYLVAKNYLREDRVLPTSVGPRKPYTSDPSAEGRAKNRRIEFTLSSTRSF